MLEESVGLNWASVVMVPIILVSGVIYWSVAVSFNQGVCLFDMKETMQSDIRREKLKAHVQLMVSLLLLEHRPRMGHKSETRVCLFMYGYFVLPRNSRSFAIRVSLSPQSL